MRKLTAFIGAAAFVVAIVLVIAKPVTAHAQPGGSIGTVCQENGFLTQSSCAKFIATIGPAMVCGLDPHGVERWIGLGYKSKGACVSEVQQFVRESLKSV